MQGHSMQAAVTLSEALRRNAKHEAQAFKYLMVIAGAPPEMIRDSSLRSE
jgi:surfactin synthase thioesterase subunit